MIVYDHVLSDQDRGEVRAYLDQKHAISTSWHRDCVPAQPDASSAVIASESAGPHEAWRAFDADERTYWLATAGQTPATIGYNFGRPVIIERFSITYFDSPILGPSLRGRPPRDFTLQGFWVDLHSVSEPLDGLTNRSKTQLYDPEVTRGYSQYRLEIRQVHSVTERTALINDLSFEAYRCF